MMTVNDQMNRINNFAVQESTCKTFVVVVPAYPSDITDFNSGMRSRYVTNR